MELKQIAEAVQVHATATETTLKGIKDGVGETRGRLTDIEQFIARLDMAGSRSVRRPASPTAAIMKADGFAAFRDNKADRAVIPLETAALLQVERRNTIVSAIGGDDVAPSIAQADRNPSIAVGPQQQRWLFQLMPQLPATSGSVEFVRETALTNNAAPQTAEGAAKAQSDLTFELVNAKVPTMAHWTKISRQALSDSAALARHLDTRLIYGLLLKLEAQMIVGDGTGGGMTGLTHPGNFTAYSGGLGGDTGIDTIRRALGQLEAASFVPDVVILNPDDWTDLELVKDQLDRYIIGDPKAPSSTIIWNRLVYTTPAMPQGQFVAAALAQSTSFYAREEAIVRLSDSDSDNFTKNLLTALAELRALSVVNVPTGIIYGDLSEAS